MKEYLIIKTFFIYLLYPFLFLYTQNIFPQTEQSFHPLGHWDGSKITSPFGYRGWLWNREFHNGIDIDGKIGDSVYAWRDGLVKRAEYNSSRGNFISLKHKNDYISQYNHLSKIIISKGDKVKGGDLIGLVGNTGIVRSKGGDGSHLHFEIKYQDKYTNPLKYIKGIDNNKLRNIYVWNKGEKGLIEENGSDIVKINISSSPGSRVIFLDGKRIGLTPKTKKLKFGQHIIKIQGDSKFYEYIDTIIVDKETIKDLNYILITKVKYTNNEYSSLKNNNENNINTGFSIGFLAEFGKRFPVTQNPSNYINYFGYVSLNLSMLYVPANSVLSLFSLGIKYSTSFLSQNLLYKNFSFLGADTNQVNQISFISFNIGYSLGLKLSKIFILLLGANVDLGMWYELNGSYVTTKIINEISFNRFEDSNSFNINFNAVTTDAGILIRLKRAYINFAYEYTFMQKINLQGFRIGLSLSI